jgi:hypothetical protein
MHYSYIYKSENKTGRNWFASENDERAWQKQYALFLFSIFGRIKSADCNGLHLNIFFMRCANPVV